MDAIFCTDSALLSRPLQERDSCQFKTASKSAEKRGVTIIGIRLVILQILAERILHYSRIIHGLRHSVSGMGDRVGLDKRNYGYTVRFIPRKSFVNTFHPVLVLFFRAHNKPPLYSTNNWSCFYYITKEID